MSEAEVLLACFRALALDGQAHPVGSRVTCSPAPTDTDRDWLVLVGPGLVAETIARLGALAVADGSKPGEHFTSIRIGIENVILTDQPDFYRRFLAATRVAKLLNISDKAHRLALFQAVLYGHTQEPS